MEMSLSQAAATAKRTRQCLASAIKKGRLSATKDANGEWKVDSAELVRVYPDCKPLGQKDEPTLHVAASDVAVELAVTKAKLAAAEARADELRRDLDAANARMDTLLHALPAGLAPPQVQPAAPIPMPPPPEPVQPVPQAPERPVAASQPEEWIEVPDEPQKPKKRGFLARWFGGDDDGQ